MRMSLQKLRNKAYQTRYEIGFLPFDATIFKNDKHILHPKLIKNPPKDKWYADPFLLEIYKDRFVLLVEEYRYEAIGRVARLEVDRRTLKIVDEKILLDLPTHLSFPNYFRKGDDVFVYPENSASGALNIYKYDKENQKLVFQHCLVKEPLVDATIFSNKNGYYISAIVAQPQEILLNGGGYDMKIFHSDVLDGPFTFLQNVHFNDNIGRNGGGIINYNGNQFRIAQDCTTSYGYSMEIQKVEMSDDNLFSFKTQSRIVPQRCHYGTHTLNINKEWIVVDVYKPVNIFLRTFFIYIDKFNWHLKRLLARFSN